MDNWMDDDEPQPDCFLSTVGAVSHSDCSNDGSNDMTKAMNEAPAVLNESNASCSFSRIEVEPSSGGAIPEDTLANFEPNDFTSTIDNTSHDYLLNTDFYGAGSSSFCNNTSNSSERKYAPSSSVNNSLAVTEIIQEMQSTNIDKVASTVERSLRVLRQLKNSTTKGQPTTPNFSTIKTTTSSTASKMSKTKEVQEDLSALHKSGVIDLSPAPSALYEPSMEEQELMRKNKIFAKCHVALTLEDLNSVFLRDKKIKSMSTLRKDRENRQKKRKETSKGGDEHRSKKSEHRRSSGSSKVFSKDRASTSPVGVASRTSGSFGASGGKSAGLKKPKKFTPMAECCVCKETIDSDQTTLPSNTSFCSKECVQKQVKIAMQCVKPGESVMLMDLNGMVLNESKSPKIEALESFLMQYPNFQPVLNTNNIEKMGSEAPINDIKSERKRVEVRKVIEHHLQLRCKSSKMSFSSKRVKQMCVEIEEELFRLTKEINSKYRNWCRGLLQKLKDESNMFFRKIINEKISVKKLVTMDPEDMVVSTPVVISGSPSKTPTGNKDQSLASASRNNVSTPGISSTQPALEPAGGGTESPIVVEDSSVTLDGGGEKMAEAEDFDLTPSLVSKQNTGRYSMAKKTPLSKVEVKSAVDNILDDAEKDTTGQHNSHLYDANCEICKNKTRSEVVLKERAERMEAKLEAKRQQEQEDLKKKIPRFPNLDAATKQAMESNTPGPGFVPAARRSSYSANRIDDEPEDDFQDIGAGFDDDFGSGLADKATSSINTENASSEQSRGRTPPPLDTSASSYTSPWVKPPRAHLKPTTPPIVNKRSSSPTIDQFNKPAKVESWKKPALIPTALPASAVVEADNPWLRNNPCIWTGSLSWGRRFDFPCSFTAISNRLAFKLGREMPPVAKVVGRIEPAGVWDYIRSLRDSWSKQVIVLLVEPPKSREHHRMYMDCYELMRQENRYGVIEFANHQTIRDGYIFALEPEEPLPKDLHPLEGPGLPDGAEQNSNIILVVIRKVDRQENMSGRTAAKKGESWKNESWRVDRSNSGMETRQLPAADNNMFVSDSTPLYSEASSVRVAANNRQQPIRAERTPYLDNSPHPMDVGFESRGVATNNRKPVKRDGAVAKNGYAREKRAAENMIMPSECEEMGVVKSAAQNAYDGPIDTLQDVLKAISVIEKPSLIVIVVGEYISSHSISEEEREIISQAIKDKSESERLRNQKKFGMQFTNNNNSREERGGSGEKFVMRNTPPLSADEEVDNEEVAQTECTQLPTVVDSTTPTQDPVNPTISRSSSRDSGNSSTNDSTKAQQISFGDSLLVKEKELKQQQSPPASCMEVASKEESPPPPPPPASPPMDSTPISPPPPPSKINVQPVALGPVPIAPPSQPSFHCLPMFVPPPPPVPTTPKVELATTSKGRPNEDMDISDEESGCKNTGDDLLPPPPPPPSLPSLSVTPDNLPPCTSDKPFYPNFQIQPPTPMGARPAALIRPTRGMPSPGPMRAGPNLHRPQAPVRLQMSLEGDIYPQRKAMTPEPRPRADNRGGEFYGQGGGGDNAYEDGPNYDGPPPPRRMKFPLPSPHQMAGNIYPESYDADNMNRGPRFQAYRNSPPVNSFQYPRPRFGGGPSYEKPHNYNHEMEMEQGPPFGHRNQNMRGRNRMPMNHHLDAMGHPRHPGWNNIDNFQSPPRFGPIQTRGMGGRAPPRGQMNNSFY